MVLSDTAAYKQVVGCLMHNPLLFLEYQDLVPADFDLDIAKKCIGVIKYLYNQGAKVLTPAEVDQEFGRREKIYHAYEKEGGLDYLKDAYEYASISNFEIYYTSIKKYALLRRLKAEHYDISEFYIDDKENNDPLKETKALERFNNASLEEILNSVESKYNIIRNDFLNGGKKKGEPAEGIFDLIDKLKASPDVGPDLEGKLFNYACRGARQGCFFLKSASTNAGKTRTSVFDACRLAYPEKWSQDKNTFITHTSTVTGECFKPRKVLFIVTEMDKEELQTIMLAYLSGVDEDHILRGKYDEGEEKRVRYAAIIMEKYKGNFIIEEISEPNLVNVEATIKKYATLDKVKYVFFDYIHTTASMMNQFAKNNLREDSILMMMANQLKQIAKDYNVFIFSATQVNSTAMSDDGEFKNEMSIRGAKSIADKCDMGYVMTRVSDTTWQKLLPNFRMAAREGRLDSNYLEAYNRPTHIIDIYKMRRGRFKNVRIWINIHLGTGYRKDLFMTDSNNCPITIGIDKMEIDTSSYELPKDWERDMNDYDSK